MQRPQRGFTLVNLLLVLLGIIVLGVGVVYLINPLEKAREGRDRVREQALGELDKAVKLYLRNNSVAPKLCDNCALGKSVFANAPIKIGGTEALVISSNSVGGAGWVPIDLALNAGIGKTPLLTLPIDPVNKDPYIYTFTPGVEGQYKLTASFESKVFLSKMADDKGKIVDRYELGSDLSLAP